MSNSDSSTCNPAPVGLLGFGMTTVLLNLHNAGFFPVTTAILAMGIFYGGIAQIIAGILEFRKGNTFGFTAFTSYGSFWLTLVFIFVVPPIGHAEKTDGHFLACYLALWGIFTLFMTIGTLKAPVVLRFVFASLTVLFALLAIGKWTGSEMVIKVAGFEGIICGASAIYLAMAEVLNEKFGRVVMPI